MWEGLISVIMAGDKWDDFSASRLEISILLFVKTGRKRCVWVDLPFH